MSLFKTWNKYLSLHSPVPSSLQLSRAKDQQELRLPSIWPAVSLLLLIRGMTLYSFSVFLTNQFSLTYQATPLDTPGGLLDEELTLDTVNLENVLPVTSLEFKSTHIILFCELLQTKTPDLSGPSIEFSQFSDPATQESEGFTPLTVDGPPRKR